MALIAGWDFRGDAKDFSGSGYDGTVTGATLTTNIFGIANSGYIFDGTANNNISVSSTFPIQQVKSVDVFCTVDDTSTGSQPTMFGYGRNDETFKISTRAYTATGFKIRLEWEYPASTRYQLDSTNELPFGDYYITFNDNGSDWDLIVNGSAIATTVASGSYKALSTMVNSKPLLLGGCFHTNYTTPDPAFYFGGKIYSVLIFDNQSTTAESKTRYDLSKQNFIYPFPQQRQGGITE